MAKPKRYKRKDLAFQLNKSSLKPNMTSAQDSHVMDSPDILINGKGEEHYEESRMTITD
jgi:hypothetical protein